MQWHWHHDVQRGLRVLPTFTYFHTNICQLKFRLTHLENNAPAHPQPTAPIPQPTAPNAFSLEHCDPVAVARSSRVLRVEEVPLSAAQKT